MSESGSMMSHDDALAACVAAVAAHGPLVLFSDVLCFRWTRAERRALREAVRQYDRASKERVEQAAADLARAVMGVRQ